MNDNVAYVNRTTLVSLDTDEYLRQHEEETEHLVDLYVREHPEADIHQTQCEARVCLDRTYADVLTIAQWRAAAARYMGVETL